MICMSSKRNKLRVKTRHGIAKDSRFKYYNEWYLEVDLEDGSVGNVSPSVENLLDVVEKAILHESFPVDCLKNVKDEQYRRDKNMQERVKRAYETLLLIRKVKQAYEKMGIPNLIDIRKVLED